MIRSIVLVSLLSVSSLAGAATTAPAPTSFIFVCTDDTPTNSYALTVQNGKGHLQALFNYGTQDMPIDNGDFLTPNDLPQLSAAAQVLEKLGPIWDFDFANCTTDATGVFSCDEGTSLTMNGVAVEPDAVYSTAFQEQIPGGFSDKGFKISLMLSVGGQSYTIGSRFYDPACAFKPVAEAPAPQLPQSNK